MREIGNFAQPAWEVVRCPHRMILFVNMLMLVICQDVRGAAGRKTGFQQMAMQ
jgi:hypothetical protein